MKIKVAILSILLSVVAFLWSCMPGDVFPDDFYSSSIYPSEWGYHLGSVDNPWYQAHIYQLYTWNGTAWSDNISGAVGPQGPQGPQGVQGIQGIQGPQGDPGDDGFGQGARVYNSADENISGDGQWNTVTFNSERWDTDEIHSTSTNTERLTAVNAGIYAITGSVNMEASSSGKRYLGIKLNNAYWIVLLSYSPTSVNDYQFVSTIAYLDVDDYVDLRVAQNSGGTLKLIASVNFSPEFTMQRIGFDIAAAAKSGDDKDDSGVWSPNPKDGKFPYN